MAAGDIRNIALVGHGGAGKTTLSEAILFACGATSRQGKVDEKNTVSDFADDEKERGHSIDLSLLHADHKGKRFQVADTPGYPDFVGQALRGLDGADLAVVVVNAYDGVLLNTRRLFNAAREAGLPVVVVVNKCDADNIDMGKLGKGIDELAGPGAEAVTKPDAFGPGCSAVTSIFGGEDGLPEGFVEAAVEADDELMEKYLEAGEVSGDDLRRAIPKALATGSLVPVFHTVAETGLGVPELLDFLAEYGPSPLDRVVHDTDGNRVECTEDEPLRAVCFKIMFERQAGRIVFLRLYSGTLSSGDQPVVARTENSIKVGHLSRFQGASKQDIESATAGDVVALPKVDEVEIGDTLYVQGEPCRIKMQKLPSPMVGLAIQPQTRGDETKLSRELDRVTACDPSLVADRVAATNELVLRGLSTLHLDVALKRMSAGGVEVDTAVPKVAYLETITGTAEGHYRHKKQTGGAGQFGEVYLRVSPLPRGSEEPLEFVNDTVGGSIPKQFIPAVEKGVRQQMAEGVVAGHQVVDVKVSVYDGKHHDVDSKEIAFIIAGRKGFSLAIEAAKPVLLEPIVDVEIEIPSQYMGDISSDLNSRRARIQGMESVGETQIIRAQAPLAEMQTYSTQLRSITAGEGSFTMDFSHYDVVPGNVAQQVIAKAKTEAEAES